MVETKIIIQDKTTLIITIIIINQLPSMEHRLVRQIITLLKQMEISPILIQILTFILMK